MIEWARLIELRLAKLEAEYGKNWRDLSPPVLTALLREGARKLTNAHLVGDRAEMVEQGLLAACVAMTLTWRGRGCPRFKKEIGPKQAKVLEVVVATIAKTGRSPSQWEIARATGTNQRESVRRMLAALDRRGFIHWERGKHRGIKIAA